MTWSSLPRSVVLLSVVAAALVLGSCKGAEEVCNPTDPLCGSGGGGGGGGGGASIASIDVTSPIDNVMAVGRTAQMSATATDTDGGTVTPTFDWSSTDEATATVSSSGLVSALAAGTTDIEASADGVTGSLTMRAVDADLDGISGLLTDPFRTALTDALDSGTRSSLAGPLSDCQTRVSSGNILAIQDCLADALSTTGAGGTDTALLGVLSLYFEQADRHLGL